MDKLKVPASVGRLPKKIQNSYGGFTADQWKSFTVLFSIHALWNIVPRCDSEVWRNFVMACSCLCSTVLTKTRAFIAHSYLLKFCQSFEQLYGKHRVTPNIHLHTHLVECVLDYGPVYSFWLFNFERYNGILGEYGTRQRAVEIQLMSKFFSSQFMKDLPLPVEFQDRFKPLLDRLYSKQSGRLQEQSLSEQDQVSGEIIQATVLSIGHVRTGGEFASSFHLYTCCRRYSRDTIDADVLPHLKKCYATIFDGLEETSVTTHFERYACCKFNGDLFGSIKSRGDRSAFVLARWCKLGGTIDTSGTDLRPGVIDYFMKQNVQVNGHYVTSVLASVGTLVSSPPVKILLRCSCRGLV